MQNQKNIATKDKQKQSASQKQQNQQASQSTRSHLQRHPSGSRPQDKEDVQMKDETQKIQNQNRKRESIQISKDRNKDSISENTAQKARIQTKTINDSQKNMLPQKSQESRQVAKETRKSSQIRDKTNLKAKRKYSQSEDVDMQDESSESNNKIQSESEKNQSSNSSSEEEEKINTSTKKQKNRQSQNQIQSQSTKQKQQDRAQKVKSLRYVDLIKKEGEIDSNSRVKFQGYEEKKSQNQICHICFQVWEYPKVKDDNYDSQDFTDLSKQEEDAKLLYDIVYCSDCSVAVHFLCLGESHTLFEFSKNNHEYLIFKCERCEMKSKDKSLNTTCIVCCKQDGFLKPVKVNKQSSDPTQKDQIVFVHQICAMSFGGVFTLVDPSKMEFEMDEKEQKFHSQTQLNSKIKCEICRESTGKMKECSIQDCEKYAHPFCVMNVLKDYYFDQKIEDDEVEKKYRKKWMYQLYYSQENEEEINCHQICSDHCNPETVYCFCQKNPGNVKMQICDYCQIWFHQECLNEADLDVEKYRCQKCAEWEDKIQNPFLDILLKRQPLEKFLDEDRSSWNFSPILFQEEKTQYVESKIMEQILFSKFWYFIAKYLLENTVHQRLIKEHLKVDKLLFMRQEQLSQQLSQKLLKGRKIINEKIQELEDQESLYLFDEIDKQIKSIPENSQKNKKLIQKHEQVYKQIVSETKLVNDKVMSLKQASYKHELLIKAQQCLTNQKSKPQPTSVKEILEDMHEHEMNNTLTFQLLQRIYDEYSTWEDYSLEKFYKQCVEEEEIINHIKEIKSEMKGLKRQYAIYKYLKTLFEAKSSQEEGTAIISEGKNLRINTQSVIEALKNFIQRIDQSEKELLKQEKINQKPVKIILNNLIDQLHYPLKTKNLETIIERWFQSAIWHEKAKSFVKDKHIENLALFKQQLSLKDDQNMYIDEIQGQSTREKSIWTVEEAWDLLKEVNLKKIYYDQLLYNNLDEKVRLADLSKTYLKTALSIDNDVKTLRKYIKQLRHFENIDFKFEIEQSENKLRMLLDAQQIINNDGKTKLKIEKIKDLNKEMTLMLKAKLNIALSLQKEFQEILKANQDSYQKNMLNDLKQIVHKASKEQNLDMNEEQETINNIPQSEEWFLQTYERLKKMAGRSLNQVDFKDFTQLATVIQDQKEVDQLLKTKLPADQLAGAASNLWKSLSGVKWLSDLRKLIKHSESNQIDIEKIKDLNDRALVIGIDYDREILKENIFERYFQQFSMAVKAIESFEEKFGTKKKLINTLDSIYRSAENDQFQTFDDFLLNVEKIKNNLAELKIVSTNGDLDVLDKLHTWVQFLRTFIGEQSKNSTTTAQQSVQIETSTIKKSEIPSQYNLGLKQIMLLQQKAEEIQLPDELSIRQYLQERKNKFEKFTRDYDDYRRFRDQVINKIDDEKGKSNHRYTYGFIKKLVNECRDLQIQKDEICDYDEKILLEDLNSYQQWKEQAVNFIEKMQENDDTFDDEKLKVKFQKLKNQLKIQPIYDKEIQSKMFCIEWLYNCQEFLSKDLNDAIDQDKTSEKQQIAYWENLIKQTDKYASYFSDIQTHPIYQRTLWEVQQAQTVIDFVIDQRNNIKNLGPKFNLDKQQNYAFFRNKLPRTKVFKMLDQAKRSKVDLSDEIKSLQQWVDDFDRYTEEYKDGKLNKDLSFERLKDILRTMYVSPLDYGEIFFKLKERIDTVEMIKLNLKAIFQEHEEMQQYLISRAASGGLNHEEKYLKKRLRYGRISYELRLFKKQGNIDGVREIEMAQEKVEKSLQKLEQIKAILNEIDFTNLSESYIQKRQKLELAKLIFIDIEIDMEDQEKEVSRLIFEADLKFTLYLLEQQKRKIFFEEFQDLDKAYQRLRDYLKDNEILNRFIILRNKVMNFARKINQLNNKEQLNQIKIQAAQECPLIDFSQLITDKNAKILLGKRKISEQNKNESQSDHEQSLEKVIEKEIKRRKIESLNSQKRFVKEKPDLEKFSSVSSSDDENSSSSGSESSSSGSGSSSSVSKSGSSSGSDQESSSESQSELETQKGNTATNRSRRKIVPNLNSDFVYEKPSLITVQKILQSRVQQKNQPKARSNSSSSSSSRSSESEERKNEKSQEASQERTKSRREQKVDKKKRKLAKQQKRLERQKKEQMRRRLAEYRLQQGKTQQTIQQRTKLNHRLDQDQSIQISSQISADKDLQGYLQKMKLKIRDTTKDQLRQALAQTEPVFSALESDQKQAIVNDLEGQIQTKHPEIDSYYQTKARYSCANIRSLASHKKIQELFSNKQIPLYRLFKPQPEFKDFIEEKNKEIHIRLLQFQQERREKLRNQKEREKQRKQFEQDLQLKKDLYAQNRGKGEIQSQDLLKVLNSNQQDSNKSSEKNKESQLVEEQVENIYSGDEQGDEFDSDDDSNPALFSDQEDIPPVQAVEQNSQMTPYSNQSQRYDPSKSGQMIQMQNPNMQFNPKLYQGQNNLRMNVPYNPDETLALKYGRFGMQRPIQPILYDPIKAKYQPQQDLNEEKNVAPPGSLLKVWEGMLEIQRDHQPLVQFFSTYDIQVFQQLPKLPTSLPLKGKAKIEEVMEYFLRLRKEKKLIRGWMTRRGHLGGLSSDVLEENKNSSSGNWQENSDRYTKLFDELESTNKAALFNVFQGVTLYLIPITGKTKEFCKLLGIEPEVIPSKLPPSASSEANNDVDVDMSIYEETHCFAVVSQIKQIFNNRMNILNPDVLRLAQVVSQDSTQSQHHRRSSQRMSGVTDAGGDSCFSPVSSDDEKQNIQRVIKQEETLAQNPSNQNSDQKLNIPQDFSQQQIKSDNQQLPQYGRFKEEDEKIDIDELINTLRVVENDVQLIQDRLMPIIHRVKGEDEVKLTEFLQDVIRKFNNPQPEAQEQLTIVKSEQVNASYSQPQIIAQQGFNHNSLALQNQQLGFQSNIQNQIFNQNQPMMNQQFMMGMPQQIPQIRPPPQSQQIGALISQNQLSLNQVGIHSSMGQQNQFQQQLQGGVMFPGQQMLQPNMMGTVPPLRPPPMQAINMNSQANQMMIMPNNQGIMTQQPHGGFIGQNPMMTNMMIPNPMNQQFPNQLPNQQFLQQFPNQQPNNQQQKR